MTPTRITVRCHVDAREYLEENRALVEAAAERLGLAHELAQVFEE